MLGCASQRVQFPSGVVVTQASFAYARAAYCEPGGRIDSTGGAFVGPCAETAGVALPGTFVRTVSIVAGALVSIMGSVVMAGLL